MSNKGLPLEGCSVMVVEDDFLLADDISYALEDAGAVVLGPFAEVRSAFELLEDRRPDLAVLDVNLGGETSFEIGRDLRRRGVPILFATGYDASIIPSDLAGAAYLIKPLTVAMLISTLVDARRCAAGLQGSGTF